MKSKCQYSEIIRAAEYIRFGGKGEFDLVASCAALHSLAEACNRRGINRAMLDGRNARAELSPNELAALVNAFVDIGFTRDLHLAILHPAERYQRARLFAFISRIKGWNVRAFGDFERAMPGFPAIKFATNPNRFLAHRKQVSVNHDGGETNHPHKTLSSPAGTSSSVGTSRQKLARFKMPWVVPIHGLGTPDCRGELKPDRPRHLAAASPTTNIKPIWESRGRHPCHRKSEPKFAEYTLDPRVRR